MNRQRLGDIIKYIIFFSYLAVLIYLVFFADMFGRTAGSGGYRYNLVPFKEIKRFATHLPQLGVWTVMINIAGNLAAFMPLGFLLPIVTERRVRFLKAAAGSFALSLTIELVQLLSRVGTCDVDDVLLNTIGGMLGYGCYALFWRLFQKSGTSEKVSEKKTEKCSNTPAK